MTGDTYSAALKMSKIRNPISFYRCGNRPREEDKAIELSGGRAGVKSHTLTKLPEGTGK